MAAVFPHVCAWFDALTPEQGAFVHALEWSARLGLPLRAVTASADDAGGGRLACEAVCRERGVAWELAGRQAWAGGDGAGPDDLYALDGTPGGSRGDLFRQALGLPRAAVLLCPRTWRPATRVLVLHQDPDPADGFLDVALRVCGALGAEPVVLTVARTEAEARRREELAERTLAARLVPAESDTVIGGGLEEAVAWV